VPQAVDVADILIVDDDDDVSEKIAAVLESRGHVARTAPNGEAGLGALAERLPDLVVLDVEMPALDGPGMSASMLAVDIGRERIPIVLSSGYADLSAIAARVGTPYAIGKPCSVELLMALVDRALRERIPPRPPCRPHTQVA
jgi:DNA-binding NtrC family response regulator